MQPLVASVDMVELSPNGEGAMEAVQARLARRKLPKLTSDGTLEYSMPIPATAKNQAPLSPDVSWILYGSPSNNEHLKVNGDTPAKRYCSAGKKRLPWEKGESLENSPLRKSVASAPMRSVSKQVFAFQKFSFLGPIYMGKITSPSRPGAGKRYLTLL